MNDVGAQAATYAGVGQRGLAFFLDSLVWLILLGQIAANIPQDTYEDDPVVVGVIFLALFSLAFNYFWLTEWKWGKTLGKAICSIHVESEDGGRPGFGPATVRNVMRLVDVIVIGPLLIAGTRRHQRLGDRFAHTVVVRDRAPVAATATPVTATGPGIAGVSAYPATADIGASEQQQTRSNRTRERASKKTGDVSASERERRIRAELMESGARRGGDSPWKASVGIPTGGWRPVHVVWGVLAMIGLLVVESAIAAAFDPELESTGSMLAIQGLLAANLIGVALGFASRDGAPRSAARELGLRRFAGSALGLAALTYIAYIVFAAVYNVLVHPEQDDVTRDLGLDDGGVAAIAAGVLIVGAAPLSEEIFFRGFMYGGLRRRMPVWAAAGISGAVFGLLHYTDPDSFGVVPQLAVLGVLLAWLYERTGSLWPPILLHVLNNGIALAIITST